MGFKFKKRSSGEDGPLEINVTPMIDMFSVILSFLLMTAVFSATGIHVIQIPFLSSAPPPDVDDKDDKPVTTMTLLLDPESVKVEKGKSDASKIEEEKTFAVDETGLLDLQNYLYALRVEEPEFDKVTLMTDEATEYDVMIKVLDALRFLPEDREPIAMPAAEGPEAEAMALLHGQNLIPKIILGNVIL